MRWEKKAKFDYEKAIFEQMLIMTGKAADPTKLDHAALNAFKEEWVFACRCSKAEHGGLNVVDIPCEIIDSTVHQ